MESDLVARTAAIAQQARAAQPTTAELRAKYAGLAEFMDAIRESFGQPVWYELRDKGRVFYTFGETPGDRSKWKWVALSPAEPKPLERKGKR